MQGSLVCPRCNTANIALGAAGCPACGVQFAPARTQVPAYAHLGHRFVAGVIDFAIVYVPMGLIFGFGSPEGEWVYYYGPADWAALVVGAIYTVAMTASSAQATIGMKVMKLRVGTEATMARLTPARALGRWAASLLSELILMIGYIMIAFTKKRQGLHDLIADTVVVRDVRHPSAPAFVQQSTSAVEPEYPSHLV